MVALTSPPGKVILPAGTDSAATEGAGDFLTSEELVDAPAEDASCHHASLF